MHEPSLTASDAASIIIFKQMFVYDKESRKGNGTMEDLGMKLIDRIRESEDPEEAMKIALEVMLQTINQRPLAL